MPMPQGWVDRLSGFIADVTAAKNRAVALKERRTVILKELSQARKERQAILKQRKDADVSALDALVVSLGKRWAQSETELGALQKEVFLLTPRYAALVVEYESQRRPKLEAKVSASLRKAETLKKELARIYDSIRRQRKTGK